MKVGTISLNINTEDLNYGAMLHSWAFVQILNSLECVDNVEVIDYITPMLEGFDCQKPIMSYLKLHRWTSAIKISTCRQNYLKRYEKFQQFISDNVPVSRKHYTQKMLNEEVLDYDCLICESDVIWSPRFFYGKFDSTFFLALNSMLDKKRIIYSASMANAEFNNVKEEEDFAKLVKIPEFISCREQFAVDYINENCERNAERVLDPVLLLPVSVYDCIIGNQIEERPYLLLYIPVNYNGEYQKVAEDYARKHGLEVVELSYYFWNSLRHKVIADAGIEEFLSLIKNAAIVFTNSYHAVCFSCLFHKDFYAFGRTTGKKTEDLCKTLNLLDRYMDVKKFEEKSPIDYRSVDSKLKAERERSLKWLIEVLTK